MAIDEAITQQGLQIAKYKIIGNVDKHIFWPSILSIAAILVVVLCFSETAAPILSTFQSYISVRWSWFIMLIVALNFFYIMYIAFSKFGTIKLGKDDDKPEYKFLTWICMLFSTGVGIGFICFGVAEPMWHLFTSTHTSIMNTTGKPAGVPMAIQISIMDWGASCWGLFSLGGLAIALPSYRKGLPMCVGSSLYGLMGDKVKFSPWSKASDVIAIIAAVCGNSAALGMGVLSICWVINRIFGVTVTTTTQTVVIFVIIVGYITSSATGLNRGIKYLSTTNVFVALSLCFFVLLCGPTTYILNLLTEVTGMCLSEFVQLNFFTHAGSLKQDEWVHWWPIFYWLWWISYIPFVGGFVARISRGRTVRQFLLGSALAPVGMSLVWFTVFGGAGAWAQFVDNLPIWQTMQAQGSEPAIYMLLETYPFGTFACIVALLSLIIFTVTTSDSASFYISLQVSGQSDGSAALGARILWGCILGAMAIAVIMLGDKNAMSALKSLTIAGAAPFCVILVLMQISTWKMLNKISKGTF